MIGMNNVRKTGLIVIFLVIFCWTLFPFLWYFFVSITPSGSIPRDLSLPNKITLMNYWGVLNKNVETASRITILPNIINSFVIAVATVILCLVLGIGAAYVCSRYKGRIVKVAFNSLLVIRMTPGVSILVPIFIFMGKLRLIDRHLGIILVHTLLSLPLTIWLIKGFIDGIPREIEEQAAIDGSSFINTLVKIIIPLAAPGMAVSACFIFLTSYNEFLFAMILSRGASNTLPLAIAGFNASHRTFYNEMAAASFLSIIPLSIFFALAGKHIVRGLTMGGVK